VDGELTAGREAVAIRIERRRLERKGRGKNVSLVDIVELQGEYRTRGEVAAVEEEVQ